MFVDLRMAKAQADYKREQLSRLYPRNDRGPASSKTVHDGTPRRSVLRLRKVWSA